MAKPFPISEIEKQILSLFPKEMSSNTVSRMLRERMPLLCGELMKLVTSCKGRSNSKTNKIFKKYAEKFPISDFIQWFLKWGHEMLRKSNQWPQFTKRNASLQINDISHENTQLKTNISCPAEVIDYCKIDSSIEIIAKSLQALNAMSQSPDTIVQVTENSEEKVKSPKELVTTPIVKDPQTIVLKKRYASEISRTPGDEEIYEVINKRSEKRCTHSATETSVYTLDTEEHDTAPVHGAIANIAPLPSSLSCEQNLDITFQQESSFDTKDNACCTPIYVSRFHETDLNDMYISSSSTSSDLSHSENNDDKRAEGFSAFPEPLSAVMVVRKITTSAGSVIENLGEQVWTLFTPVSQ